MVLQKSVVIHRYGAKASTKIYWEWRNRGEEKVRAELRLPGMKVWFSLGSLWEGKLWRRRIRLSSHPSTLCHARSAWHTPPLPQGQPKGVQLPGTAGTKAQLPGPPHPLVVSRAVVELGDGHLAAVPPIEAEPL